MGCRLLSGRPYGGRQGRLGETGYGGRPGGGKGGCTTENCRVDPVRGQAGMMPELLVNCPRPGCRQANRWIAQEGVV